MDTKQPLTLATLGRAVGPYGGLIHGDDDRGWFDVEFTVPAAVAFADAAPRLGWWADLRDDVTVRSLKRASVTLTVRPESPPEEPDRRYT